MSRSGVDFSVEQMDVIEGILNTEEAQDFEFVRQKFSYGLFSWNYTRAEVDLLFQLIYSLTDMIAKARNEWLVPGDYGSATKQGKN